MGSVPSDGLRRCVPVIEDIARQTALRFVLPWHMADLKEAGLRAAREASYKYDAATGTPFEKQMRPRIRKAADQKGEGLQASAIAGQLPEPSNDQAREALKTFSAQEWRELIGKFEQRDIDTLRPYLDANKEPLIQWLGQSEFNAIFCQVVERGLILFLRRPVRMTTITDAMWAAHIYEEATQHNIAGTPRPSVKRSWSEVKGLNNIAESLNSRGGKVTPYKVKQMLERMECRPFEEFVGDYHDYFFWATDPKAFKHHLRLRETAPRPRRDPDPYFRVIN